MQTHIPSKHAILEQLFWFCLFLGWVPWLATYAFVLDPIAVASLGFDQVISETAGELAQQRSFLHRAFGVLTLAGFLSAGLMYAIGKRHLWGVPVFLIWSSLIYVFNATEVSPEISTSVHVIYAGLAVWVSYLFLRYGHITSVAFIGFIGMLLADVLVVRVTGYFGEPFSVLGLFFVGYVPSFVNLLLLVATAVLLRMFWLIWADNRDFLRRLSKTDRKAHFRKAFRLWFLMPVIFVVAGIGWWAVLNLWWNPIAIEQANARSAQVRQATAIDLKQEMKVLEEEPDFQPWRLGPDVTRKRLQYLKETFADPLRNGAELLPTEDTLEAAQIRLAHLQIEATHVAMVRTVLDAERRTRAARAQADDAVDSVETGFPEESLPLLDGPERCYFWQVICKVEKGLVDGANEIMLEMREDVLDGFEGSLHSIVTAAEGEVGAATEAALSDVELWAARARTNAKALIEASFRTWRNLSLLAAVYSLIVLLKTFGIVFSRVVFAPGAKEGVAARFMPDVPPGGDVQMKKHKQRLRIPKSAPEAYFVSRWGVTLEGVAPARRRPLGFRYPIARILSGTWAMNRIEGNRSGPHEFSADLKVDEPAELVSWELAPDERVVFRFADFVGMSEGLTVHRLISLSITTLVLGRTVYHYAEGPGVLVLRTTASARISPSRDATRPAPMAKLVAWGSSTEFNIFAALTVVDTFLSGYNIKKGTKDRVLWDTSTRRGDGPGSGILRFVKSFLLPI